MLNKKLFSFHDNSIDTDLQEYEEAILERDKLINQLLTKIQELQEQNDLKTIAIQKNNQNYHTKLHSYSESIKKLTEIIEKYRNDYCSLKSFTNNTFNNFKNILKENQTLIHNRFNLKKDSIRKKLNEIHKIASNMTSIHKIRSNMILNQKISSNNTSQSTNPNKIDKTEKISQMQISESYINIIERNFKSLDKKIENLSNNFQENRTRNYLINIPLSKKFSLQNRKISLSNVKENQNNNNNNSYNQIMQTARLNYCSKGLNLEELKKIKEKYYGLGQKFKGLVYKMPVPEEIGKISPQDSNNPKKRDILDYLKKIEEKLGINEKIKDESFDGLLNHLHYKSF